MNLWNGIFVLLIMTKVGIRLDMRLVGKCMVYGMFAMLE